MPGSSLADDHLDWIAENGAIAAPRASRPQNRQVLGIWRGCPRPSHVHVRSHRALARLHLVRDLELTLESRLISFSEPNHLRYAIGNAERPILNGKIGWLDALAADTNQHYTVNGTGGPSIKVSCGHKQLH